jgi:Ca2+-binding EF-hand superfamily protein
MEMARMMARWFGLGLIGLCLATGAASQQAVSTASASATAFERFLKSSTPICQKQPSARCVDAGWRYADTDRDGSLSLAELQAVHQAGKDWFAWKGDSLPAQERASVSLALAMIEGMGVDRLMQGYDTDGDGRLSRAEALVDVHLDERPLGDVLRDPNGLDRQATARRLGIMAPLFSQLFR